MIITRSPLRISLGGGGTDLPSYYRKHTGFLIAAAIDKYVCITLHDTFVPELIIKYSKLERVSKLDDVEHPIVREALRMANMTGSGLEITSMADIPAGTGLGSSGSFTTALLKALHTYKKTLIHPRELAEEACFIELDRLGEPIGKQDQYIAAFGGLTCFQFLPNDQVQAYPLKVDSDTLYALEDNLLLFFTGYSRSASGILKEQDTRSKQKDQDMVDNLHFVKELGYQSKDALEKGDLLTFAELMNVHWQRKKQRSGSMSNGHIDSWYELALANGAVGGKLIGAGGGGFLMFYAEEKAKLRQAMTRAGLREVRFRFDFEGTKVVFQGEGGLRSVVRAAARVSGGERETRHHGGTTNMPADHTVGTSIADVPAAILAGGLATRLRPITTTIPKAMVEVAGRPFIAHQLDLLRENGVRRLVLCLGHLGEQIEHYLGDGTAFGIEIRYSHDGDRLLGTGGALRRALPLLGPVFWVMYGDSYMDIDYPAILEHFLRSRVAGLMTVLRNDNRWDRSNVAFHQERLLRYNKHTPDPEMHHIDYGAALLRSDALERLPQSSISPVQKTGSDERFDLADLYSDLVACGQMVGHEVTQRFYEIGSPAGLAETETHLRTRAARSASAKSH